MHVLHPAASEEKSDQLKLSCQVPERRLPAECRIHGSMVCIGEGICLDTAVVVADHDADRSGRAMRLPREIRGARQACGRRRMQVFGESETGMVVRGEVDRVVDLTLARCLQAPSCTDRHRQTSCHRRLAR